MIKSGLVMNIEGKTAVIMSPSGSFYKVAVENKLPNTGEEFSGRVKSHRFHYKSFISAASILFIMILGGGSYAYYYPINTIVVDINPSIQLETNLMDKVITYKALNKDGALILNNINIKNKSLSDGLSLIVQESKKDKFIDENYINTGKQINVTITSKTKNKVDLSDFEGYILTNGLNANINNAGTEKLIKSKADKVNDNAVTPSVNKSKTEDNISENKSSKTDINKGPNKVNSEENTSKNSKQSIDKGKHGN